LLALIGLSNLRLLDYHHESIRAERMPLMPWLLVYWYFWCIPSTGYFT